MKKKIALLFGTVVSLMLQSSLCGAVDLPIPPAAVTLSEGGDVADFVVIPNDIKWYTFTTSTQKKVTIRLNGPSTAGVNYDLKLYRKNPSTNTITEKAVSLRPDVPLDQISNITDVGAAYYVAVQLVSGMDSSNPFHLGYFGSTAYDSAEPDDSPWQAPSMSLAGTGTTINGTKDNNDDQDWRKIVLTKDTTLWGILARHSDTAIPFSNSQLQIYDAAFNLVTTINPLTVIQPTLVQGTYYLSITGGAAGTGYSLRLKEQVPPQASSVQVTNIASDGGIAGFVDYGYGSKWRVKRNITVTGTAYGANSQPIANAAVVIEIGVKGSTTPVITSVTTNSSGAFSAPMALIAAIGQNQYNNGISWHYYDIVPIKFRSNNQTVTANISSLYHYAYAIYNN